MPLVSSSIPNLVNGVSQQPSTLRLASQAELQENGLSTVSQGLKKRPPTRHIKRMGAAISGTAFIHTINRDTSERYEVVITNGDLKVYDMDGNEKVVLFPYGKGYLGAADPASSFRAVTVADYTFVVNKNVTVTSAPTLTPARPKEALVVVKNGLYSKTYKVLINGSVQASFTTPDGTVAAHAAQISTDNIAAELTVGLQTSLGVGWSIARAGSVIYVSNAAGLDFTISTEDGYSNAALLSLKTTAQRFSDLPSNAFFQDFTIRVAGDANTDADDYYVKFDKSDSGVGVWREVVAPGVVAGFAPGSMPWGLIRNADGTFTFKILPWAGRSAGDASSAPDPSFVGRKIQDVFFYRNRLGFLADEAVSMSEAGEFFNFYPTTMMTLLDSDPIDVSASHTKVSLLNFAVPFNKKLLLFSAQTQFSLDSGDTLTAKTVSIKPTTEFECSTLAAPVGVGRTVYFAVPKGIFEGMREYYIANTTDSEDAADVTSHVPKYISKGAYKISAALNEDFLTVLTTAERNVVYTYKFYWNNNEKLQSAWSKWVFPATDQILSAEFIEGNLFLVINRPDGLYLEKLNVTTAGDVTSDEPYNVHLDRKQAVTPGAGTYNAGTNKTQLTLGWTPNDGEYVGVVAVGQSKKAGVVVAVDSTGKVTGNYEGVKLIVGRKYTFRYKFSPLLIRSQSGQGQKADTIGRLQIRKMAVNFAETGYFQVKVTPYGRDTYTYTYTGKTLGVSSADLGAIGIEDGNFPFPVLSQNTTVDIELTSDSAMPCSFMSADWEGYYVRRSQAV